MFGLELHRASNRPKRADFDENHEIMKSGQIESRLVRSMRNDLTRLVPATAEPITAQKELF